MHLHHESFMNCFFCTAYFFIGDKMKIAKRAKTTRKLICKIQIKSRICYQIYLSNYTKLVKQKVLHVFERLVDIEKDCKRCLWRINMHYIYIQHTYIQLLRNKRVCIVSSRGKYLQCAERSLLHKFKFLQLPITTCYCMSKKSWPNL